jgi:hypothetical protein
VHESICAQTIDEGQHGLLKFVMLSEMFLY